MKVAGKSQKNSAKRKWEGNLIKPGRSDSHEQQNKHQPQLDKVARKRWSGRRWLLLRFGLPFPEADPWYLCCLPSVYSRYENGKREPSIDILLKLSKLYGVSVDCLIGNDEVVDTSITEKEAAMISAMRQADERARQDAIALLELHTGNKKI